MTRFKNLEKELASGVHFKSFQILTGNSGKEIWFEAQNFPGNISVNDWTNKACLNKSGTQNTDDPVYIWINTVYVHLTVLIVKDVY